MGSESEKRLSKGKIWSLHKVVYSAVGRTAIAASRALRVNKSHIKICFRANSVYRLKIG